MARIVTWKCDRCGAEKSDEEDKDRITCGNSLIALEAKDDSN